MPEPGALAMLGSGALLLAGLLPAQAGRVDVDTGLSLADTYR
jgi:hypothetical protein